MNSFDFHFFHSLEFIFCNNIFKRKRKKTPRPSRKMAILNSSLTFDCSFSFAYDEKLIKRAHCTAIFMPTFKVIQIIETDFFDGFFFSFSFSSFTLFGTHIFFRPLAEFFFSLSSKIPLFKFILLKFNSRKQFFPIFIRIQRFASSLCFCEGCAMNVSIKSNRKHFWMRENYLIIIILCTWKMLKIMIFYRTWSHLTFYFYIHFQPFHIFFYLPLLLFVISMEYTNA